MATLTAASAANIRPLDAVNIRTIDLIAGATITRGQAIYEDTNGLAQLARGNAVGTAKVAGIATVDAVAGQPVTLIRDGRMVGWDLSGVNAGTTVYLSSGTAGAIDGAAVTGTGNVAVPLGTVRTMTDVGKTKYILFTIPQNAAPVAL